MAHRVAAWIGVLVNYFDRVNLSVSHEALITTFGISAVTFGYLSGAYNWTYAMCQLPIGVLLDKFGIRRVGLIGTFLWGIASFGAAITPNLGGFFAARLIAGCWGGADVSGECKGHRLLVSRKRAEFRHSDL